MSDPTDDQKPQPDSADSGRRPSSSAPGSGPADAPDADRTQRISRDQLPGAGSAPGKTERIPRDAVAERAGRDAPADAPDKAATDRIVRGPATPSGPVPPPAPSTPANAPAAPRPGVRPSPLPPRPGVAPSPKPPVPPRPGAASPKPPAPPVNRDASGPSKPRADAETQKIARGAVDRTAPDVGAGDKTTFIPKSALPGTGGKLSGAAGSDSAAATPDQPSQGDKTEFIPRPATPQTSGDPKTIAMPVVPDASNAETTALPIQRPGTDRVTPPPGGRAPITKPPATPRSGSGPKNTVPQGPAGPPQNAPTGEEAAGPRPPIAPRPGGAPSPADMQSTTPAPSMSAQTAPLSAEAQQASPPDPQQTQVIAAPQRIPGANPPVDAPVGAGVAPRRPSRRWLLAAGAAVIVIIAVIAVVVGLVAGGKDNSPEAKVKSAIGDYTSALAAGNLPDLQASTCGAQHDFYRSIAPDQYASVHKLAVDQRKIPKVDAVDSVQITGDKAVAQAGVYTDADPTRIARTFDLQNSATGWKVCDSPNAGP